MSKIKNTWFPSIALLLLAFPLALHAYLGSFSRFLGDDYCSAYWGNRFGVLRATWYWYITWSGRYSASALDSIVGILGPKVVPFVTFASIAVWLFVLGWSLYFVLPWKESSSVYNQERWKGKRIWIAGLLAVCALYLTFNFTPNVQQSLYWGQGMRTVIPPLILGTAYWAIFVRIKNADLPKRRVRFLYGGLSFFLAFGIGGFSETYCAMQLVAFGFALVVLKLYYHDQVKSFAFSFLFSGLLGALLSFMIVLFAPGNQARAVFYLPPPNLAGILGISVKGFFAFIRDLFSSVESVAGFSGVFFLSLLVSAYHTDLHNARKALPVVSVGGLLLIFADFPPAAYAISDAPPGRTLVITTYLVALLVIFAGFALGGFVSVRKAEIPGFFSAVVNLLVLGSLLVSGYRVSADMLASRQSYSDFASAWDKTHSVLMLLRDSHREVVVPAVIDEWSGVLRMADNPRFYVNVCVSQYYGLKSIVARDDMPPTLP